MNRTKRLILSPDNRYRLSFLYMVMSVSLLLWVSGCTPATHIATQAPVELPKTFSQPGGQPAAELWWHDLHDPQLERLISTALASNFTLLALRERLLQAEAAARRAGSDLRPAMDLQGSGARSRASSDAGARSQTNLLLGVAANYELDLWGRLQARKDAAVLDARASRADFQAAALTLAAQVAHTWYRLAETDQQLALAQQQQDTNRQALELIRARFFGGQTGIADVLQQQQLIESKTSEQARLRSTARLLEHQLALLVGVAPATLDVPAKLQLVQLPPLPATGVPLDLLANRPDIRSRHLELLAADKRVGAAIADRFPRLSITAGVSSSAHKARDLFDNWLSSLAANLIGPLIDGGSRRAEVERSKAAARQKLYLYSQTILEAIGEVEDALIQETEQRTLINSLELQLKLATETLHNVRDRYRQGAEEYQRVLSALLSQQSLQRNVLEARRQLVGYRIDLYRALGSNIPLTDRHPNHTAQSQHPE